MNYETLTVTQESTTLDLLIWRRFGREIDGRVDKALHENPGMAQGPFLAVGTKVEVEVGANPETQPVRIVRLWT